MTTRTSATQDLSGGALEPVLLRFATAGSVDDGKSTLVGRLLHDSKSVLSDQLESVTAASRRRGSDTLDLALLTDGLRAEREQGITIDVAYRYFATPRRRFILADTPGHVQYTRNMATGASTADVAVILVDARHGVVEQTRRHAAVAALLGVPHVVLAVNKMDLAGYAESVFSAVTKEFDACAASLGLRAVTAIPLSALAGDNVVDASRTMTWYTGPTLLEYLETVPVGDTDRRRPVRLPVQYVIRPPGAEYRDYRGYAGRLASGVLRTGDRVTVLPSGLVSTVAAIDILGEPAQKACAPQSVTVRLADDIDVSRGDLIATGRPPAPVTDVRATVCHLRERPLRVGDPVLLRHTTRTVRARVVEIPYRLDTDRWERHAAPDGLAVNDIGRVVLHTAEPLALDPYECNRETGSFLLLDPADGATLTAGMVGEPFGVA
ncbi:sulfate adenylyltransferase subunit 1 [Streptomyces fagopyri]|uniref:sulfate adenylyltransferase subunit 1 n=1 Tax=Streptomyces fagopyri TaxID=2662397 RepID=UPI003822ACB9